LKPASGILGSFSGKAAITGDGVERTLANYIFHAPVFLRRLNGVILYWTAGAEELYGFTPAAALGRVSHELLQTVFPSPLAEVDARLVSQRQWEGRLRHTKRDGTVIWTESLWHLKEGDLVVEQNTDVSAQMQLEREREHLIMELEHRIGNTLAVVQAVASMTFRGTVPELTDQFDERIQALAHAIRVLTRGDWYRAPLREIILEVARALGFQNRITLDGPDVELRPSAVHAYTLGFHELATNAIKHGALSQPEGRVEITWAIWAESEARIHLIWREHGGPVVMPPQRLGFGSRLLENIVASELGTPVEMRYEPGGFVCEFDGPLQKRSRMK
jgi:PAS domain S-box-containing protein